MENYMPMVNGVSFRCECGCNVFHKPDSSRPDVFRCNSCGAQWIGVEKLPPTPCESEAKPRE